MRRAWVLALAACGAQASPAGPRPPVADPAPRLGAEPAPPADLEGRAWLEAVHRAFHPRWAEAFLEQARLYLARSHPVNDPGLVAVLRFGVTPAGAVVDVTVANASGVRDFDDAAREVVMESAPLPPPPEALRSDDGNVYAEWRFARDARQDGVAGARVERRQYDLARAVPLLVARGRHAEALERIAAAGATSSGLALAQDVAGALLERALADAREPGVRVEAAEAIAATGWRPAAAALRRLAQDAPDLALQTASMRALGALGDREAVPLLSSVVARLSGERAVAAAGALADMGEAATAWRLIEPELVGDMRLAALGALARVGDPRSIPLLARVVRDRSAPKPERVAAAVALGAAADSAGGAAARALQTALGDGDAAVRAAAAMALAQAAARGVRSRGLFAATRALMADRDPRVRTAAVAAAARLDARRAAPDVIVAARSTDPGVQAACAAALAEAPGPEALATLLRLASARTPEVRLAAVVALARRDEVEAQEAVGRSFKDDDPRVRAAAVAVQEDESVRRILASDTATEVRAAALTALLLRHGGAATLPVAVQALARAGGTRERVQLAAAFLRATRGGGGASKPARLLCLGSCGEPRSR